MAYVAPSAGVCSATVGAVLSTFTVKLAVPTFPASSVQLAVSVIVPSPLELLWVVQLLGSIVERGSVQFQSTVTSLLFQPLAFGPGCATGLATGGAVSSNVIVIEPSPTCTPSVSVESVTLGSMWLDPPPPPPPSPATPCIGQSVHCRLRRRRTNRHRHRHQRGCRRGRHRHRRHRPRARPRRPSVRRWGFRRKSRCRRRPRPRCRPCPDHRRRRAPRRVGPYQRRLELRCSRPRRRRRLHRSRRRLRRRRSANRCRRSRSMRRRRRCRGRTRRRHRRHRRRNLRRHPEPGCR